MKLSVIILVTLVCLVAAASPANLARPDFEMEEQGQGALERSPLKGLEGRRIPWEICRWTNEKCQKTDDCCYNLEKCIDNKCK